MDSGNLFVQARPVNLEELLRSIQVAAMAYLEKRTVQLLHCARAPDGRPIAHGSGTLFRMADLNFIVTAAHVLKWVQDGSGAVLVGGPDGRLVELAGQCSSWPEHDVAVLRLDASSVAALGHKEFVTRLGVRRKREPKSGLIAVYGFPVARTQSTATEIRSAGFYHGTCEYLGDTPPLPGGFEPLRDLLLELGDSSDFSGNDVELPHLNGMSGCGTWSIFDEGADLERWTHEEIRLLGVQVSVVAAPHQAIRAVRWDSVIGLLAARWPELDAVRELFVREG